MNIHEWDILLLMYKKNYKNQRLLAESSGYSLGIVNRSLKYLYNNSYIDEHMMLTDKAQIMLKKNKPQNAIILAAGYGMRMVPINTETPKGLLTVHGEPLIERLIKQLQEVGIKEIYIVVGFMKEAYEYLIDQYGVDLVVNEDYALKNNLYSLKCVLQYISNSYIVPCDLWCRQNLFRCNELYSWYMVNEVQDEESTVRVNRKRELVLAEKKTPGNKMIGIAYILDEDGKKIRDRINRLCENKQFDGAFWEETLYEKNKFFIAPRVVSSRDVVEINTYEELRDLDNNSMDLKSDAIRIIMKTLNVDSQDVENITVLKKGMTNRSFLFMCHGEKYIMRIPGEGTSNLINRKQEADVYCVIRGKNICDDVLYINPDNGYKITKYLSGARVCNPDQMDDVKKCIEKLRNFHEMSLVVKHEFDIFRQIEFYESLWSGNPSIYKDYRDTKRNVFSLKKFIENNIYKKSLTHIDAVPDNFLFTKDEHGNETIRLIDWEYSGMQDPHVDIAMFCIYALYDKNKIDKVIDIYFQGQCPANIRVKIYCYVAACGLLWSNWCEYKRSLGVDFGEYSLKQYRYAKEFYRIASREILEGDYL